MGERVALVAIVGGGGGALGRATAVTLAGGRFHGGGGRPERAGLAELPDGIHREVADTTDPPRRGASSTGSPPRSGRLRCW